MRVCPDACRCACCGLRPPVLPRARKSLNVPSVSPLEPFPGCPAGQANVQAIRLLSCPLCAAFMQCRAGLQFLALSARLFPDQHDMLVFR